MLDNAGNTCHAASAARALLAVRGAWGEGDAGCLGRLGRCLDARDAQGARREFAALVAGLPSPFGSQQDAGETMCWMAERSAPVLEAVTGQEVCRVGCRGEGCPGAASRHADPFLFLACCGPTLAAALRRRWSGPRAIDGPACARCGRELTEERCLRLAPRAMVVRAHGPCASAPLALRLSSSREGGRSVRYRLASVVLSPPGHYVCADLAAGMLFDDGRERALPGGWFGEAGFAPDPDAGPIHTAVYEALVAGGRAGKKT